MNIVKILLSMPKTIYFNFKVFPVVTAVKLPVFIGYRTVLRNIHRGAIEITCAPHFGMIKYGHGKGSFGVEVNRYSYFSIDKNCKVVFRGKANLSEGISVRCDNGGIIDFGRNFMCNQNCFISSNTMIAIGEDTLLGWNISIRDSDGHDIYSNGHKEPCNPNESIFIGNHVWIASHATLLKGIKIPDDCIVGYGALITEKFNESNQIFAGVPARVVKRNINWNK